MFGSNMNLFIDKVELERVACAKFVGLFIDQHLTWDNHIEHCKKKVSKGVYAINMAKNILAVSHLNILYYSLVLPYLIYGLMLWGNTYHKYLRKLEIVHTQKYEL